MKIITGTAFRQGKDCGFWFRVFGYGIAVSTMKPLFSERNGYTKTVRLFRGQDKGACAITLHYTDSAKSRMGNQCVTVGAESCV